MIREAEEERYKSLQMVKVKALHISHRKMFRIYKSGIYGCVLDSSTRDFCLVMNSHKNFVKYNNSVGTIV
jgi:hypothetical protein